MAPESAEKFPTSRLSEIRTQSRKSRFASVASSRNRGRTRAASLAAAPPPDVRGKKPVTDPSARSLGSRCLSASSSFFSFSFFLPPPHLLYFCFSLAGSQPRIVLRSSSTFKGGRAAHAHNTRKSKQRARVYVTSPRAPRNSLTAQTGTESESRYRSCCRRDREPRCRTAPRYVYGGERVI